MKVKTFVDNIKRPDVFSNVFYFFQGINLFNNPVNPVIPISFILLSIGSGVMHYFKNRFSAHFDWLGMYFVFSTFAAQSWFNGMTVIVVSAIMTIVSSLIDITTKGSKQRHPLIAIVIILIIGITVNYSFNYTMLVAAIAAVGFVPWFIAGGDYRTPTEYYPAYHTIWHIITSYLLYIIAMIVSDVPHLIFS